MIVGETAPLEAVGEAVRDDRSDAGIIISVIVFAVEVDVEDGKD